MLFGGNDPAALLHTLLGTGFANHALSGAYLLLFIFIPVTLAAALVFSPNLQAGLFYASAQSLNWLLGAASYFLLPSLGPDLPPTRWRSSRTCRSPTRPSCR